MTMQCQNKNTTTPVGSTRKSSRWSCRLCLQIGNQSHFGKICMPSSPKVPQRLQDLSRGPQIGRGISGVVWRGTDPAAAPGCEFAVKEMPLPCGDGDEGRRRLNEVRLAYRADHPHVVTCYEVRSLVSRRGSSIFPHDRRPAAP